MSPRALTNLLAPLTMAAWALAEAFISSHLARSVAVGVVLLANGAANQAAWARWNKDHTLAKPRPAEVVLLLAASVGACLALGALGILA